MDRALNAKSREPEGPQDLTRGLCHTGVTLSSGNRQPPSRRNAGSRATRSSGLPTASRRPRRPRRARCPPPPSQAGCGRDRGTAAGRRVDAAGEQVGVLERIDVDRLAVGVSRPALRAGRDRVPAVERRGVVGRHRAIVAAVEGVDRLHAADREALGRRAGRRSARPPGRPTRSRRARRYAGGRRTPSRRAERAGAGTAARGSPGRYDQCRSEAVTRRDREAVARRVSGRRQGEQRGQRDDQPGAAHIVSRVHRARPAS